MRILHIIENLNIGGAEYMLLNLAIEQVRRQHQVEVMCLFDAGDLAERLISIGVIVTPCHKNNGLDLAVILKMMRIVRAFAPDIVHSHSLMGNYYLAVVRILTLSHSKQIVTRHGLLREGNVSRLGMLFDLSLWMTHWAVGVCDAVTDELLTKHARFSARILTIKNGINLQRFNPRPVARQNNLKMQLKLDNNVRLIGIVARLNPIKNHRLLLEAFALLLKNKDSIALVIVGDGVCRQDLETYATQLNIAELVFFLGDRADVDELLPCLEVFVLCSNNEGYSLALLEAAAASLPIVATDVGGNADIIQHGVTGLIVPPQNPVALAAAIAQLLSNSKQALLMGIQARAMVEECGSVQVMADSYEKLYQEKL